MRASWRSRAISRSRSAKSDAGAPGVTVMRTGPSNRDSCAIGRPDSIMKLTSRKSCAICAFDRIGAKGRGTPNWFIGGITRSASGAAERFATSRSPGDAGMHPVSSNNAKLQSQDARNTDTGPITLENHPKKSPAERKGS